MRFQQLASRANLLLAWRRITTGGNYQYKNLFRNLYYAYEVAIDANLKDLRQRLLGGTFQATPPERIYIPKESGLHRPIALLHIEDQIVLQAFANLAAKRLHSRREPLQSRVVFSNILEKPDSIFFFRRWRTTYSRFQKRIRQAYQEGLRWVGDFDLAAFYDTISHELLIKTIYPRTTNPDLDRFRQYLQTWSSNVIASGHGHGLPQGPLASDFLAECFLLPIDEAMRQCKGYLRYVDDVRLLGATEDEVRAELIDLERHCRERGLIPQTGKFAIKEAKDEQDAMGMLPSIADPQHEGGAGGIGIPEARRVLLSAIDGRPYRVKDKTRLRYVLYRADPDPYILQMALRLIPRHPEHTEVFFYYLGQFDYRKPIERVCRELIENSPYAYVRSQAWRVLAQCLTRRDSSTWRDHEKLSNLAIEIAKDKGQETFVERWGACHFLCASQVATGARHSRFIKYQGPLLQALVGPVVPPAAFARGEAVDSFLRRSSPEPGLSVCSRIHELGLTPASFGLTPSELPSQVANLLLEVGVIGRLSTRVDPVAEILASRYQVPRGKSWHRLLGSEYVHALGILKQAEATVRMGPSLWLASHNSFNHLLFLALQRHLHKFGHPAACKTVSSSGEQLQFGVMLEPSGPFSRNLPVIANCFREMNSRRNRLPVAHPYEKKTAAPTSTLKPSERNRFVSMLRGAYRDISVLMP